MLPATARLPAVKTLIDDQLYFVLHAPRQTGKTTALRTLAQDLTESGDYTAILVSMESGDSMHHDLQAAEPAILGNWRESALSRLPADLQPPPWPDNAPGSRIRGALRAWSQSSPRPLVVFLDEIDTLQDDLLISVLRQLRDGYADCPSFFPWSLALVGMRDVRDYKVASDGSGRLHTSSSFNIKARSLTLSNFTAEEVAALYQQHTDETGQPFTPEAVTYAFDQTQGQPWLVNALALEITGYLVKDRSVPITRDHVEQAREIFIHRQDTHLDSLTERLREPRVRQVMEPMLAGQMLGNISMDDRQFVIDLGLVRRDPAGGLVIANPIYREVIPRALASGPQDSLPIIAPAWLTSDGQMDKDKLLASFLAFWRHHGQPLLEASPYAEIAPHLVLMAFLHRVVNAGGTIEREYAIGTRRMDVCVRYGNMTLGIELKTWRTGERNPTQEGLQQLDRYLAGLGLETGWLVIFDQRKGLPDIAERTRTEMATTSAERSVTLVWA
jgi:hypothetical protein